jgi:hypothetical protein
MVEHRNTNGHAQGQEAFPALSICLAKGGWPMWGVSKKLAASPVTSTGSMPVPLSAIPGQNGLKPQLALSYDLPFGSKFPGGFSLQYWL